MKAKVINIITFFSIVVVNLSTLGGGIKHHETWQIIVGGVGTALVIIAIVFIFLKPNKLAS